MLYEEAIVTVFDMWHYKSVPRVSSASHQDHRHQGRTATIRELTESGRLLLHSICLLDLLKTIFSYTIFRQGQLA
jgi:hypothetical protein